ncbi:MAG: hypothetical protein L6Q71_05150, partial [Planctomycetes bacterium]|nr:hypothetical protein [Planctomycetota bacterium]
MASHNITLAPGDSLDVTIVTPQGEALALHVSLTSAGEVAIQSEASTFEEDVSLEAEGNGHAELEVADVADEDGAGLDAPQEVMEFDAAEQSPESGAIDLGDESDADSRDSIELSPEEDDFGMGEPASENAEQDGADIDSLDLSDDDLDFSSDEEQEESGEEESETEEEAQEGEDSLSLDAEASEGDDDDIDLGLDDASDDEAEADGGDLELDAGEVAEDEVADDATLEDEDAVADDIDLDLGEDAAEGLEDEPEGAQEDGGELSFEGEGFTEEADDDSMETVSITADEDDQAFTEDITSDDLSDDSLSFDDGEAEPAAPPPPPAKKKLPKKTGQVDKGHKPDTDDVLPVWTGRARDYKSESQAGQIPVIRKDEVARGPKTIVKKPTGRIGKKTGAVNKGVALPSAAKPAVPPQAIKKPTAKIKNPTGKVKKPTGKAKSGAKGGTCSIYLSPPRGNNKREAAAGIIAELQNISEDAAMELTGKMIIPVLKDVDEDTANTVL